MRLKYIILSVLALATLAACEKDPPKPVSSGSFTHGGNSYPVSMVRVEHVDYTADSLYVLRFTAYPSSYKITEKAASGYGAVLNLYFVAESNDFGKGTFQMATVDTLPSTMTYYPNTADAKAPKDTVVTPIAGGQLAVDSFSEPLFMAYGMSLYTADGDSVTGTYTGLHVHNRTAVQPAYGTMVVDTIRCSLAEPTIVHWGKLFGTLNYSEIIFYSTDAKFTDSGSITSGVQFVVGISTDDSDNAAQIAVAPYPVATDYYTANSTLYGHKVNNTAWGTHWQLYRNGSAAGKANILSGEVKITDMDESTLSLTATVIDQLNNTLTATYSGPYR